MAYQALYRKWRPVRFSDVIGQLHVTQTLKNEVARGKIAHAYLFTGSRGTGKTTCSKILAKAVNCPHPVEGDPCCACEICRGIEEGSILDVVEIDAASNNGVDNIRDLREEANFTPTQAKYRVYIIDEAHMLSTGAFNALLKIMEEPPEHVLFILATTEVNKVLPTILSRCQRFDFKRVQPQIIAEHLQKVAAGEGFSIDAQAAMLIARLADGGVRDALSLLDVCRSQGEQIDIQIVGSSAGLVGDGYVYDLSEAIVRREVAQAFSLLERLSELSIDYERLSGQLISHFRNLMICKTIPDPAALVVCMPDELERLRAIAGQVSISRIFQVIDLLQETVGKISRTASKRLELEMTLIKLCSTSAAVGVDGLLERLERLETLIESGSIPASRAAVQPRPDAPSQSEEPVDEPQQSKGGVSAKSEPAAKVVVFGQWEQVLQILSAKNPALRGALNDSRAYESGDLILIDAPDPYFLELIRSSEYAKASLREALFAQTSRKYRLGPYKKENFEVVNQTDPLTRLEDLARQADIPVEIK